MADRPGQKYSEETFGENAKQVKLSKGTMFTVGQTLHDGEQYPPAKPTSVNVKTGWPGNDRG